MFVQTCTERFISLSVCVFAHLQAVEVKLVGDSQTFCLFGFVVRVPQQILSFVQFLPVITHLITHLLLQVLCGLVWISKQTLHSSQKSLCGPGKTENQTLYL